MSLPKINPTETNAWKNLYQNFEKVKDTDIQSFFAQETNRLSLFHIKWEDFIVDFSKNRLSKETFQLLQKITEEVSLKESINQLFNGEKINDIENRRVQHTALRDFVGTTLCTTKDSIEETRKRIKDFSEQVISGNYTSTTNKAFTDIINIGIGGSDLGPKMVLEALKSYKNHLNTHFISNVDGDSIHSLLSRLNPETTLVIVVSKTFTTQETLLNATIVKEWLEKHHLKTEKHVIAVSSNAQEVEKFGITSENLFPMWDFVGGRYSLWSAVGLSIALNLGFSQYEQLLKGACAMDLHFKNSDYNENIPVILALLSIWYNNFFAFETHAVIPYCDALKLFPTYLQQVVMESNGKSVDRNGQFTTYQTGNILWGAVGTDAQHAFFQLLHQGTKIIPTDFIGFAQPFKNSETHDVLMSNFFAQTEALMIGKKAESENNLHQHFEGNRPTNTILIKKLTPYNLGALIALYEHKTFVEGIIWNIYSFDQFGVEYGKILAKNILNEIKENNIDKHDASTSYLLKNYLKMK